MREVTDPNLIAQLESGPDSKEVTDPNLISQLENGQTNKSPQDWMHTNPISRGLAELGLGAVQSAAQIPNIPHNLTALISSKLAKHIPSYNAPTTGTLEKYAGLNGTVGLGGKIMEGIGAVAPFGIGASGIGLSQALGAAGLGAAEDKNPIKGALEGYLGGRALEFAPSVLKGVFKKGSNIYQGLKFKPQDIADTILNDVGSGLTKEENSEALADSIKNNYLKNKNLASSLYDSVYKNPQIAGKTLYQENVNVPGAIHPATKFDVSGSDYQNLSDDVFGSYPKNIQKIHNTFIKNPTIENAKNLQDNLGNEIGSYKFPLDAQSRNDYANLKTARDAIQSDIRQFLPDELKPQLDNAAQQYKNTVAPYQSVGNFRNIINDNRSNLTNVISAFRAPNNNVKKVVSDLSANDLNKIVYDELSNTKYQDPKNLAQALDNLKNKGLSSYVSPSLEQRLSDFKNSFTNKQLSQDKIQTLKNKGKFISKVSLYGGGGLGGLGAGYWGIKKLFE